MQAYSNPDLEYAPGSLPDLEILELTAEEATEQEDELWEEYSKRYEYRLCRFNQKVRDKMVQTMIQEHDIKGGWFYWWCTPGHLPDSIAYGPYPSAAAALEVARELANT